MTKQELINQANLTDAYDTALPQIWLDRVSHTLAECFGHDHRDIYDDIRLGTVMSYPKNIFGGFPLPLSIEAKTWLEQYAKLPYLEN